VKHLIAIDQSTSATKAALIAEDGSVVDCLARAHRQITPQPGWVEHDAEEIYANVCALIAELRVRHPHILPAGLSLANQRETVVVFDRATGRPLHHAIVWQCRRSAGICAGMEEFNPFVAARTGLRIDPYFSASKVLWLMRHVPGLRGRLASGEAVIGTMDAFLIHRLTDGRVFATDATNASRTLLFNLAERCWDEELCALFEIPRHALPEVRDCDAQYGAHHGLPVCGVMGDSQASLFAQRCFQPGMVKATFGTGTSVLLNTGGVCPPAGQGSVATLAWSLSGQPVYALEGIINWSAASIAWLRDQLGLITRAEESEALAASVPDTGGVQLVPAFAGLGAPWWAPEARAAFTGMTSATSKAHLVRAALESIAWQVRDVLSMLRDEAGPVPSVLMADGGPVRNAFLMQFTADACSVPVRAGAVAESSALGAAFAGMLGLRLHRSVEDIAALPRTWTEFRPSRDVSHRHQEWRAAVAHSIGSP
jgi:glycerol kinase